MFRILVANSKGGCGKTTLTTSLAGYFARSGRRTTLVDCDPQASSLAWCGLRAAHLPRVHALASNDPTHGLSAGWMLRVPPSTQVMLIDTPAGLRAHEFERFARHADVLVIPVVPSPIDLRATLAFFDMVRKLPEVRGGRLRIALVASRLRERTRAAKHLEATLDRLTQAAKIRVRDSQLYVALAENGRSLFDDDGSVARPHREDWKPLLEWLEKLASAQTQGNVTPIVRVVPEAM
jgi:chromosome partitioning protein